jgi:hypothetical protein
VKQFHVCYRVKGGRHKIHVKEVKMSAQAQVGTQVKTKETIPLFLAVAITVVVSLPFGLFLGKFNLPLFVAFIVWAEYFTLGAKPDALKIIYPAFILGTLLTGASMFLTVLLAPALGLNLALAVSLFIGVGLMVYIMRFSQVLSKGSLAYFNGISMLLAIYFTSSYPATANALVQPWMAVLWTCLGGILGGLLGWFNVVITFPRQVEA